MLISFASLVLIIYITSRFFRSPIGSSSLKIEGNLARTFLNKGSRLGCFLSRGNKSIILNTARYSGVASRCLRRASPFITVEGVISSIRAITLSSSYDSFN